MTAYRTREELIEEVEDLGSALEDIYAEATSENPNTDKIANLAGDSLGFEGDDGSEDD